MSRKTPPIAATVLVAFVFLVACGNDGDGAVKGVEASSSSVSLRQGAAPTAPVSQSAAIVQKFTTALDELGIKHDEPKRTEVGLSGAQFVFDLRVDGYDAGINIFRSKDALATWQEASDSFGGVHVALPDEFAVLSLNSSEGIADSVRIAPKIAEAVGGTARGV